MIKRNKFSLARLETSAKVTADILWRQLNDHERSHDCSPHAGLGRSYCPVHEMLQRQWHRAFVWRETLLWLLDVSGKLQPPATISEEVRPCP